MFLPQREPPRLKKDHIWTEKDSITVIDLSLIGLHRITISLRLTIVKKFIKKIILKHSDY